MLEEGGLKTGFLKGLDLITPSSFLSPGEWNQRMCNYYTEKGIEALSISRFLEEYFQKTN
jgi:hypothetical protein